ncbi:MAG: hypothetical protein MZV63_60215 [Marinilabiliales bacterium]|nr:hypothetical protein [Marinilabiliales bacterium]
MCHGVTAFSGPRRGRSGTRRVAEVALHRLLRALRVPLDDRVEHRRVLADDLVAAAAA